MTATPPEPTPHSGSHSLTSGRLALLLLVGALGVLALKLVAAWYTNSIAVLSDAAESLVNLATAVVASIAVVWAHRPPDEEHPYGHHKAEYFAAGFVGSVVLLASISIAFTAIDRLLNPAVVEALDSAVLLLLPAAAVNAGLGLYLKREGRRRRSPSLEAEGQHLTLDVLTTGVALLALLLTELTDSPWIDPLAGLGLAFFILYAGAKMIRESLHGLMDSAWPPAEKEDLERLLETVAERIGFEYHALRTRQAASRRFLSLHVLVPGVWSVQRGHDVLEEIEKEVRERFPNTSVMTHLEPLEDPCSFADQGLFREE